MKFFRKRNKIKSDNTQTPSRSVVFLDRSKKNDNHEILLKRRNTTRRKFGKLTIPKRALLIFLIFALLTSGMVWFFIKATSYNTYFISPLPINVSAEEVEVGKKIINELKKNNIQYTSIDQQEGSIYSIKLVDKTEVLIGNDKDITSQIASLQFIYNRLTMEGKLIRKLDLRFDKPVIIFK